MQDRPRHRPEAVPGNFGLGIVAHAPQGGIHRRVAHRLLWITSRKDLAAVSGQSVQVMQYRYCLGRQWDKVFCLGLGHGVTPFGLVQVEARPFGLA